MDWKEYVEWRKFFREHPPVATVLDYHLASIRASLSNIFRSNTSPARAVEEFLLTEKRDIIDDGDGS
jgi:hypothetical protein